MSVPNGHMRLDLRGRRFGRLVAVRYIVRPAGKQNAWRCQCDCGKRATVITASLRNGNTQSCGCLHRAEMSRQFYKHGGRRDRTTEYEIWCGMIKRCENAQAQHYDVYGGRGVKICRRWRRSFAAFLADMGPRPLGRSIDRFPDKNGDYRPGNCRWATAREQAQNTRTNRMITYRGEQLCVAAWARRLGIKYALIHDRLRRGWSVDRALEEKKR